jgi:hypothetical protein
MRATIADVETPGKQQKPVKPPQSLPLLRQLTFSSLCRHEVSFLLDVPVQVVAVVGHVGRRVLSDKVDFVFLHELVGDFPRRIADDLVHIATMADRLEALDVCHDRSTLQRVSHLVVACTDDEIDL